jgi:hypothetical protein
MPLSVIITTVTDYRISPHQLASLVLMSAAPNKEDHPLAIETFRIALRLPYTSQGHNLPYVLISAALNTWRTVLYRRESLDLSISHDYVRHFPFHLRYPTHP